MSWFWFAFSAAVLWGFGYTINQITLKYFDTAELLLFESSLVFCGFVLYFIWKGDWSHFVSKLSNPKQLALILASSVTYVVASIMILKSISSSNASLASIIESCYPIFTILFAYLIFGKLQLNLGSAIGTGLIICGIVIVKLYGKM